jgi:hypothetical protein
MDKYLDNLEIELKETIEKLAIVSDTVDKIANEVEDKIEYGSKVLITWEDGRTIEGRVWDVKGNGVFGINRDGYAGTINLGINKPGLTGHSLRNLSIGTYGKLEREKWLLTDKVSKLQKQIEQTIESRVRGIKESLFVGSIGRTDLNRIISSVEFRSWYTKTVESSKFPSLDIWPERLLAAIAKEFILQSADRQVYNLILKDQI